MEKYSLGWLQQQYPQFTVTAVDQPAPPQQATVELERTDLFAAAQYLQQNPEVTITAVDQHAPPEASTVSSAAAGLDLARLEAQSWPPTPPSSPPVSSLQCLSPATNTASSGLYNADLARQLARMDEKLDRLRHEHGVTSVMLEMSVERLMIDRSVCSHFEFVHLETREKMREFEEKLGQDTAYADAMVDQLKGANFRGMHLDWAEQT
ncbi:palladin [Anopheles sinensis]|uniref:Palladin n=1 Tax=Anopheles sinensis TaxID=74873 RepID=A0A084VJM0_ANOSI|nr:palladin [Anopheles sinensis]